MQSPKSKNTPKRRLFLKDTSKKGYTMKKCSKGHSMDKEISDGQNNSEIPIKKQEAVEDPLTELLRNSSRRLLAEALEAGSQSLLFSF